MTSNEQHFGVAYGMGVDSTAILVELVRRRIRPDFILFADVGAEKQATYDYLPIINEYLARHSFPAVTVLKYVPKFAPYNTLEGNMVMNATLPGATFGRASCTVKWKITPQDKWQKAHDHIYPGQVKKAIGFDASEGYRKLRAADKAHAGGDRYDYWYPLIDWGWDRQECKRQIALAGLPVPEKSSCIFCPNMKPEEIKALTPAELARVMRVEITAEPYNKVVEGLWRRSRKADGRPGSMTEFIINEGLEYQDPDTLDPMPLNPNCGKFKNGFTFRPPHREESLAELVAADQATRMEIENLQHAEIIEAII